MRSILIISIAGLLTIFAGCVPLNVAEPVPPVGAPRAVSQVILISIDGYRADYLQRGDNPVLEELAKDGVRARWMTPSFPTVTESNHYTFLTGLYPDHHGIVANTIEDRYIQREKFAMEHAVTVENPRWWSDATPLWLTVQRAGMRSAEVAWPSGYVRIDGMRPDLHINGSQVSTPGEETAMTIRWLALPANQRPRLILLHYALVDATGHRYGPDSPELDAALRTVDAAIGHLVVALTRDGLYRDTDLVVVSDHGMVGIPPGHRIYLDDMINLHAVRVINLGAGVALAPRHTPAGDYAETALLRTHPHLRCWHKHDLPAHLHYGNNPRIPPIVCLATPGWLVTTRALVARQAHPLRGTHGYDNLAPSMRALFIAEGPSFKQRYVAPPFPDVDVYPLLTNILDIEPEHNDGDFAQVEPLLRSTRRRPSPNPRNVRTY